MSIFALIGVCLFLFLVEPELDDDEIKPLNKTEKPSKRSIEVFEEDEDEYRSGSAPLIDEYNRDDDNLTGSTSTVRSKATFTTTFGLLKTSNMIKLLGMIIMSGAVLAVFTGLLVKMITNSIKNGTDSDKLTKALYAMILLGVGEVIGSSTVGQIIDYSGNKIGIIVVLV
jgi:hypothetical protein